MAEPWVVCLFCLRVQHEHAWERREKENESVLNVVQSRQLYNGQVVVPRSGWKDGSGMLGRHLCWRYRFESHWLIRKIEIMGLDMKTICDIKRAKVRVLGSIRIYEECA